MPIVLTQHFSPEDRSYADVEGALYHFPRVYLSRLAPFSRFIYYRPLGRSQRRMDSRHYFGYGMAGAPYPDVNRSGHYFVDLYDYKPFPHLVPLRDPADGYYETASDAQPQAQAAVREISEVAYWRILAAANADSAVASPLDVATPVEYVARPASWPRDALRRITEIPAGAGYVPRADVLPDRYEAAALQERARADHQRVLRSIARRVQAAGGACLYNNNIDLLAVVGEERILVEAKSLNDPLQAVNRMRYGMGQLMDYSIRYRAELQGALPVLAFGARPPRDAGWIGEILNENGIAFVCAEAERPMAANQRAREIGLFANPDRESS